MKRTRINNGVLIIWAVGVLLLLLGVWWRSTVVFSYDGPQTPQDLIRYTEALSAYSDLSTLYFRDGLASVPVPYLDYQLEYPIGTGLFVYTMNIAAPTLRGYFLLSSLVLAACGVAVAGLVKRFPRGKLALFALSPALALYVNLNWDLLGILIMVVALLLFLRERYAWAAVALAAAVWTKFFPLFFLPLLVVRRWMDAGTREALRFMGIFTLASVMINAPVLLLSPEGWWHFFAFNAKRGTDELNLYTLLFGSQWLSSYEMNRIGLLLLLCGLAVLFMTLRHSPSGAWLPACCAILAWFFFLSKITSPQYDLWIVALLALIGAAPVIVIAWSAADLLFFAAHWVLPVLLGMHGDEARMGVAGDALWLAAVLRELMLVVVAIWCVRRMTTSSSDPTQKEERGKEQTLAG